MFCKKCGKEISDESNFCPKCGEPKNVTVIPAKEKEIERDKIKNYLIPSIIALFICLPLAIPAILYSLKTEKKLKLNEIKEAYDASRAACGWMSAAYISIVAMVPVIAILAAIALPAFNSQVKKSKDQQAIQAINAMRSNLGMAIADLEGDVPAAEDIRKIFTGGEVKGANNSTLTVNIRGFEAEIIKIVEFENDSSKGYVGYIKCGTAIDQNGVIHEKIPFKYIISTEDSSEYASATFQFAEGFTDSKGNDWSKY